MRSAELGLTSLGAIAIAMPATSALMNLAAESAPPRNYLMAVVISIAGCISTLAALAIPQNSLKRAFFLRASVIVLLPLSARVLGGSGQALLYLADVVLLIALLLLMTRVLGRTGARQVKQSKPQRNREEDM